MSCVTYACTYTSKWRSRMAAMERGDLEGFSTTNISSPFHKSVLQIAGRPRKYEGSWFSGSKRIYLADLTLKELRAIKSSYRRCSSSTLDRTSRALVGHFNCLLVQNSEIIIYNIITSLI